ncbi:MurR/RpiR family transcriptional regulator [Faecalicatena orotica]|uniref:RpiR family transcriptional regulator n=1 Tax=Faecalicatena orotica TaxID=1544 RepID=A0A2Y9BAK9_9FIRM|nr:MULTISPECIES: MurR/RpiR family transcriptional regulator [Clostridia]PWJ31438.1 RpiR family transcriptional regulator [Faecalicatena orotica]SSA54645.1 transcriptional regulator, RpiR family [Faecalicatena orotica]
MDNTIFEKEALEVIKENYDSIFSAEKKVADFVLQNPQKAVDSNVSELAKQSGVSDATVVRMCHHIGYTGYYQFRIALSRELGRKQYATSSRLQNKDEVGKVFHDYAEAMIAIGERIDVDVMWKCVNLLKTCRQAHLMAVGNTCPLTQYMGFRLGRLGIKSTYNVAAEYFLNHVNLADPDDILIAISQSGTSRQVVQGMELGKEKGLKIIAITAFAQSPVAALADYVLLSAGKEEPFNYYKGYAHLNETAVIDALLNFVMNEELIKNKQADKPEIILSEYKM